MGIVLLKKSTSVAHALQPVKYYYYRISAFVFIACSAFVTFSAYQNPSFAEKSRNMVLDATVPVINLFSKPAETISGAVQNIRDLASIREENAYLKEQNRLLNRWQSVAYKALTENESLRKLAKYSENSSSFFISSRIVSETGGPFSHSGIISTGSNQGVETGMAVVSEAGLVGRVSTVASSSAKIMMLTDLNSRIPVVSSETGEKFIASGTNSQNLDLLYTPEHSNLKAGDKILTSGDGGQIPAGIIVGTTYLKETGELGIAPDVEFNKLSFVGVVNFSRESN